MGDNYSLSTLLGQGGGAGGERPTGEQVLECTTATAVRTKDGTKDAIKLRSKIIGGPFAGATVYDQLTLTLDNPDALGFFFGGLEAWGIGREVIDQCDGTLAPIVAALPGRRVLAELHVETWNHRDRTKVKTYLEPAGEAGDVTVDEGAFTQFSDDDDDPGF